MHRVRPKKRLGQHFLKDANIAQKIFNSIENSTLPILEVGPGTGILTRYIISSKRKFVALDVDNESIDYLLDEYPENKDNFILVDFLKEDIKQFFNGHFILLGNFPYNISSQIFFKILENKNLVDEVVCMVQKEVAERICIGPGSKTYGILSVLLQTFYETKLLFTVSEKVFIPPPKVKSAVMRLSRNNRKSLPCDEQLFFQCIKKSFNQRRKTLRNSLKEFDLTNVESDMLAKRPEQLYVEDFITIAQNVK